MQPLKLIECPRDAMQGWKTFIPTKKKIAYINQLLKVGFYAIDFGSFVSPKAIPQMADTKEVVGQLEVETSSSKLLAIVANLRGATDAAEYKQISYIGFPFSISPTFQMRNTNSDIQTSFNTVKEIKNLCDKNKQEPVIYISMAFGNPYGDKYDENIVLEWIDKLAHEGIKTISLADTVGLAQPAMVSAIVKKVVTAFPDIETGVHLHSGFENWKPKVQAALDNGCLRFDGALKGIGGCPMANDELVGNMDSELMIDYFEEQHLIKNINGEELKIAADMASKIFI